MDAAITSPPMQSPEGWINMTDAFSTAPGRAVLQQIPLTWKPMPFTNTVCSSLCHTRSPGRAGADRLADGSDTSIASPPSPPPPAAAAAALLRFCGTSLPSTSRLVPGLPVSSRHSFGGRVCSVSMCGDPEGMKLTGADGRWVNVQAYGRLAVCAVYVHEINVDLG
jgi:hypothetical protein